MNTKITKEELELIVQDIDEVFRRLKASEGSRGKHVFMASVNIVLTQRLASSIGKLEGTIGQALQALQSRR
jgi:hypothetical protein